MLDKCQSRYHYGVRWMHLAEIVAPRGEVKLIHHHLNATATPNCTLETVSVKYMC